jgi:hypothetical protein
MRIVFVIVIWTALLGGVVVFEHRKRPVAETHGSSVETPITDVYALEIASTFPMEPDAFALQSGKENVQPPSLVVRLNGREVLRRTDHIAIGRPIRIDSVKGLVMGRNEFLVKAYPSLDTANQSHALRVRVLRNGDPIAEHSLWNEPGAPIDSTFELDVEGQGGQHAH